MSRRPPYAFVDDVTSDLSFVAHGATLEALFAAAAEALLAATVVDPRRVEPRVERAIELAEPDLELLLLRFLGELVYLRDAEHLLLRAGALRLEADGEARLAGALVGEPLDRARHELDTDVKAVTAYGLRVARDAEGWTARVTLDV
ncbi:MAG: archease [Myxococcota bacterium]|nr:archease [Myxococcota bacterium]